MEELLFSHSLSALDTFERGPPTVCSAALEMLYPCALYGVRHMCAESVNELIYTYMSLYWLLRASLVDDVARRIIKCALVMHRRVISRSFRDERGYLHVRHMTWEYNDHPLDVIMAAEARMWNCMHLRDHRTVTGRICLRIVGGYIRAYVTDPVSGVKRLLFTESETFPYIVWIRAQRDARALLEAADTP